MNFKLKNWYFLIDDDDQNHVNAEKNGKLTYVPSEEHTFQVGGVIFSRKYEKKAVIWFQ